MYIPFHVLSCLYVDKNILSIIYEHTLMYTPTIRV